MSEIARARHVLRVRGVRGVALATADEILARIEHQRWRRRRPDRFLVHGDEHVQLVHLHNRTWRNERAVEVPIGLAFLDRLAEPQLELGNVLSNYGRAGHVVVDKYEHRPGVLDIDIVDYEPAERFGAIVALSTLEHVGWDEERKDPAKIPRAVQHLRNLLLPSGRLLITCPLTYNPYLDSLIAAGDLGPDRQAFLVRGRGRWSQTDQNAAFATSRMGRYGASSLWVAEFPP